MSVGEGVPAAKQMLCGRRHGDGTAQSSTPPWPNLNDHGKTLRRSSADRNKPERCRITITYRLMVAVQIHTQTTDHQPSPARRAIPSDVTPPAGGDCCKPFSPAPRAPGVHVYDLHCSPQLWRRSINGAGFASPFASDSVGRAPPVPVVSTTHTFLPASGYNVAEQNRPRKQAVSPAWYARVALRSSSGIDYCHRFSGRSR